MDRFQWSSGTMVDFNDYMSVALSQCGNDEDTFTDLVSLWNREKESIQNMTKTELRSKLSCP